MPTLGETLRPGDPSTVAGVYQCTAPGCTSSFVASLAGAPLPSAHHPGALWRLTTFLGHPKAGGTPPGAAPSPGTTPGGARGPV